MNRPEIRLLLSDIDGTLLSSTKELTARTVGAVDRLRDAGVLFALTSSRPPRGMRMMVDPLHLTTPLGAFNGGIISSASMDIVDEKVIAEPLVEPLIHLLREHGLTVWVYQDLEWYVLDPQGPHVRHEAKAIDFEPTTLESFDGLTTRIAKIVGVSDDDASVAAAHLAIEHSFGQKVSATCSQTYYLDVTHPDANKGRVVDFLSRFYQIPVEEIATIGDMYNDVAMFERSGLSIAMANGPNEVQDAATMRTTSNDDDGFAHAVEHFILHR